MTFEVETFYNMDSIKSFGVSPLYGRKLRDWQQKYKANTEEMMEKEIAWNDDANGANQDILDMESFLHGDYLKLGNTLYLIDKYLADDEKYRDLRKNAERAGLQMRRGQHIRNAAKEALKKLESIDADAMVAEFTKIDALPSAYVQTATGDGDGDVDSCKASLGMCRHVVAAFKGVLVIRLVLRDEMVEYGRQVATHVWVVVLIETKSTTRMLHKQMQQPHLGQRWQLACDFAGYQMTASRT